MSNEQLTKFPGAQIDVTWDARLCIHVGECGKAEGELFVGDREPWCLPDLCSKAEVREVIERCPSGALTYRDQDGPPEQPPVENTVTVAYDGPLYAHGDLQIAGAPADMPGVRFRAALCRCGASANKPFCDNSHQPAGFADPGAVGERGTTLTHTGGPLSIQPAPDGPLVVNGNLRIRAGSGRLAWEGTETALCRCGASENKPFCDGSHARVGFRAD